MKDPEQLSFDQDSQSVIRHKARRLIGQCGFTTDDREDLCQELTLELLIKLPRYDFNKASRQTFATVVVDRKSSSIRRHRRRHKRNWTRVVCSLDDPIQDGEGNVVSRGETISQDDYDRRMGVHDRPEIDRLDMRIDVSIALDGLSPELRCIAECLKTCSIAEAARELGIPRSTLYEIGIAKLRREFEDKGLREYL